MSEEETAEIFVSIVKDNEANKAILVNDGLQDVWIPRSLILGKRQEGNEYHYLDVPEWFAIKEGLV